MRYIILFILISACNSAKNISPIAIDSEINKKQHALVIISVEWKEKFFDLNKNKYIEINSNQLVNDAIRKNDTVTDINYLSLYYINNLKLIFKNNQNQEFVIEKYNEQAISHRSISIYPIENANQLKLTKFIQAVQVYKKSNKDVEFWSREKLYFDIPIEFQWQLENGNIYYLGHLQIEYMTEKINARLFGNELLNKNIQIKKIILEDNFVQAKKELKKYQPWFQQEKIINISKKRSWINEDITDSKIEEHLKKKNTIKKEKEKDKDLFF